LKITEHVAIQVSQHPTTFKMKSLGEKKVWQFKV